MDVILWFADVWNVHGDCENVMVLEGHRNAVLQVQWSADGG